MILSIRVLPRCRYQVCEKCRQEFWQVENQSEEKLDRVREPAQKFAQALLR